MGIPLLLSSFIAQTLDIVKTSLHINSRACSHGAPSFSVTSCVPVSPTLQCLLPQISRND